jgi:putative flippase GtrA
MLRFYHRYPLLRFLIVGALNTAVGYALFATFILLGFHYALATLFAVSLGVLFNFRTIGILVFRDSDPSKIYRFALVYAVVYGLNVGLLRIAAIYELDMLIAGALIAPPIALVSFALHRVFVFGKPVIGVKTAT